jgi:hypothetical protein
MTLPTLVFMQTLGGVEAGAMLLDVPCVMDPSGVIQVGSGRSSPTPDMVDELDTAFLIHGNRHATRARKTRKTGSDCNSSENVEKERADGQMGNDLYLGSDGVDQSRLTAT